MSESNVLTLPTFLFSQA